MMSTTRTLVPCGVVFAALLLVRGPQPTDARPTYSKVFQEVYPDREDTTKCSVCHVGEKKTNRTEYGKAVEEALGAKNVKDVDVIKEALKKAEDKLPKSKS